MTYWKGQGKVGESNLVWQVATLYIRSYNEGHLYKMVHKTSETHTKI